MDHAQRTVQWRELAAVVLMVVLCDLTIYRGTGFAGYALLFALAPLLLAGGAPRLGDVRSAALVGVMLLVLAARLLWGGSAFQAALGFGLLAAFAMSLAGMRPYVLETAVFGAQALLAGWRGLWSYGRFAAQRLPSMRGVAWLSLLLPGTAFVVFAVIFVLANPDLLASFGERVHHFFTHLHEWLARVTPAPAELLFWGVVAWLTAGLLRPVVDQAVLLVGDFEGAAGDSEEIATAELVKPAATPLYPAFRNTLATVIALFAVYLTFEFQTLWFREFPAGFHYSGYAHEGAAWLTVALALATAILSLVFRGRVLSDPRLPNLRRLAWVWSAENLLLAAAVYNRLFIYIGFNGMTRMRMVGLFGISAVVAGFLLVLWKIARHHNFLWLMRRQLWTLAAACYLFALTPVDLVAHSYNVRRILAGDPAPSVQISVHPIRSEGLLVLTPLLECDDPLIREGVRAMLAARYEQLRASAARDAAQGWTRWQIADRLALEQLHRVRHTWRRYTSSQERATALETFHEYAYQWY